MERKLIGKIDVDSGLVWIGDPCYTLHKDEEERNETIGRTWEDFCCKMDDYLIKSFSYYENGREGLGICTSTLYGDGTYPVFAEMKKGENRPSRIIIDFDLEESEDEKDQEDESI